MTDTKLSNDLRHTIYSKDAEGNPMTINIRLNDECKNGHQDFSITGDIYQKGKPKTDRYFISGGCIHEDILKAKPELKIFVNLHLCDYQGIPMYAVENGFYNLRKGFNTIKPDSIEFKAKFGEEYRITPEQFDALNSSRNQLQYALKLQSLGILEQWEKEAKTAIELLESWTGKTFLIDSAKTQYHAPTQEEIQAEKEKEETGYYTPEAISQRNEQKKQDFLQKMIDERDKKINEINIEFEIMKQVFQIGGKIALDNCIYYNYNKTIAFNWRGYGDSVSEEIITKITNAIKLPDGVSIENKKK